MLALALYGMWGCAGPGPATPTEPVVEPPTQSSPETPAPTVEPTTGPAADVVDVEVTGDVGAYTFAVALRSDETGCDRYADWWEVVDAEGTLVYRRVLGHSHVSEQPFTRSGGPVDVSADEALLVRGHMNPGGYVGMAMEGSVSAGFEPVALDSDHLSELQTQEPLPDGCAF